MKLPSQELTPPRAVGALGSVMLLVLLVAAAARWLAYTGYFGSDEVTYTGSAFKMLDGDWSVDTYVGANRLGVNLPVAAFGWLLGKTELAAALFSLLCSLGEVALVTWAAWRMFGARAALMAGLLMASLPTHVHFAGRLMADSPLCLSISASFVLFYLGEARRWPLGFFLAGVCAGLSFWVKPAVLFVFGVLAFYPLVVRRFNAQWLWMVAGLAVALLANGLLFKALTGNFWFIFDAMRERRESGYLEAGTATGEIASDLDFYLRYLFGKVYHSGLLGYLALLAMVLAWRAAPQFGSEPLGARRFVIFWALGLMLILSVLPVGFKPLVFVPKQTNYMLIFMAPLALLGGDALARLPKRVAGALLAAAVAVGLLFALLLQGSVAVFTANSRATLDYVQAHPSTRFYVMGNALRAAQFDQLVGARDLTSRVLPIKDWTQAHAGPRLAVIDEESYSWDSARPFARPGDVPACWTAVETFRGQARGWGAALLRGAAQLPGIQGSSIGASLVAMATPRPAHVYRVPVVAC